MNNVIEQRLLVQLPTDVADELIESGTAFRTPITRTGELLLDVAVTGLTVLTSTITLAQGPAAIADMAHRLAAWRHRTTLSHNPIISVNAAGPRGRVSLELTANATKEQIAETVSLVLGNAEATKERRKPSES
jgi:hypothetical protein